MNPTDTDQHGRGPRLRATRRRATRAAAFALAVAVAFAAPTVVSRTVERLAAHDASTSWASPDDPADGNDPDGWKELQWNFAGPEGVRAPGAWANVAAAGAPGGDGVVVAVLDTGVAYPGNPGARPASPDFRAEQFVPGYDFVDDDDDPYDEHGHGTHVASTIAEETNNGFGVTGLAYGVRIMPVRVLGPAGGDGATLARGVRFAAEHGAKVINLSLNFGPRVTDTQVPELVDAIRDAIRGGTLIVAGAGNEGVRRAAFPAREAGVVAVGATTEHGCLAAYSNYGPRVDLVAPGGGRDAAIPGDRNCRAGRGGAPIYQMTLAGRHRNRFEIAGLVGTSMAAPHVTATAALVVASGVVGDDPSPGMIERRLERTARDLGPPGCDALYGCGIVDAAAATAPERATR